MIKTNEKKDITELDPIEIEAVFLSKIAELIISAKEHERERHYLIEDFRASLAGLAEIGYEVEEVYEAVRFDKETIKRRLSRAKVVLKELIGGVE